MAYSDTFRADNRSRHMSVPLLEERDRYLDHLFDRGTSRRQVRIVACMLIKVVQFLSLDSASKVTTFAIENAQNRWEESLRALHGRPMDEESMEQFGRQASNWLRYSGLLIERPEPSWPYGDVIPRFLFHIRNVRGMTEGSVKKSRLQLTCFLRWAEDKRPSISDISNRDVEQYIVDRRNAGNKPGTIATACHVLRGFFRYAEMEGIVQNRIASSIRVPSVPRYDPRPRGPRWKDVRAMIASCSGNKPSDLRARAILLLFAIYGLRSSEVSNLALEDIDWYDESFLIRRAKNGGTQRLPLQFEVGEAILLYLKAGRPKCKCRSLFVTLHTPYRAVPVGSLLAVVRLRMKTLGIEAPQTGPRGFRHACATQLLHKGYSLSEIADFLGHRNTASVSIYAKPSASSIRRVSSFSCGGLQ